MKADQIRIKSHLNDIKKNSRELQQLIDKNELKPDSLAMKAAKYLLIELAEAMANTIQHILAKEMGIIVSGYIDSIVKANRTYFQGSLPKLEFRVCLNQNYKLNQYEKFIAFVSQCYLYLELTYSIRKLLVQTAAWFQKLLWQFFALLQ